MGIYDRDYYRQGGSGFRLRAPRTAIGAIIIINLAVYVVEIFAPRQVVNALSCHVVAFDRHEDTLSQPWMWWQLLTCGFVHDPVSIGHIAGNMLTLFFLGRDVEERYGTREFIRLYLAALVFASLVWAVSQRVFYPGQPAACFGASGAITAVVVLYALLFPRRMLLYNFVIPVPTWLLGAIMVGWDVFGAMGGIRGNVAYACHLGGAAFALAYYNFRWNFGHMTDPFVNWIKGHSRPSLKVFKPDGERDHSRTDEEEVDRILTKIHHQGEQSLTSKERRTMEKASREYRRRRDEQ